jgi:hypothetical protein
LLAWEFANQNDGHPELPGFASAANDICPWENCGSSAEGWEICQCNRFSIFINNIRRLFLKFIIIILLYLLKSDDKLAFS